MPQQRSSQELPEPSNEFHSDFGFNVDQPFKTKIWFNSGVKTYVCDRIWSEDQKITDCDDGGIIIEMTAISRNELISFVLSFNCAAKLLEPQDLVEEVRNSLTKTLKLYQHNNAV